MFEGDFVLLSVAISVSVLLYVVFCCFLLRVAKVKKMRFICGYHTLENTIWQNLTPYVIRYRFTDVSDDFNLKNRQEADHRLLIFNVN
jgi:hypothetical protein